MTIPADVQQQLAALSDDQRARVTAIVRRYVAACRRQGVLVEMMGKVVREAMELVELEDASGEPQLEDWSPATIDEGLRQNRYDVYRAPVEG